MKGTDRLFRLGMLLVAALIGAALADPPLPGLHGPSHLVVLLDDSASLGSARVDAAWQRLRPMLEKLPGSSLVTLIRVGADPAVELNAVEIEDLHLSTRPPRSLPLPKLGTDLSAALQEARDLARAHPDQPPPRLLVVSDGRATEGDTAAALQDLEEAGLSPLWWDLGADAGADAWIERLQAPRRLPAARRLPLRIVAGSNADSAIDGRLTVILGGEAIMEREARIEPDEMLVLDLTLPPLEAGRHMLTARLETSLGGDALPTNNTAEALVEVAGAPLVLVLSEATGGSALAAGLTAGGWRVETPLPDDLGASDLRRAAVLILDSLPATALSSSQWREVGVAVTGTGTGLVVLGGPGTFAAGGYRGSSLETLLPVTSEPPKYLPAAALLFALDHSGSMGQPTQDGSRLALARQAVVQAAALLGPRDWAGLLGFTADAQLLLPIAARANQSAAFASAAAIPPGGGTRLAPAVDKALDALSRVPMDQRLLVLISDGQIAGAATSEDGASGSATDVTALGRQLAAADINLIAIGVGDAERLLPLSRLATAAGGNFHAAVSGVALPQLVDVEVRQQRDGARGGPVRPVQAEPLPFPFEIDSDWPALLDYAITTARPSAAVPLRAPNGDPLLAWHHAGVGRVAVLTAGIGPWAPDWHRWSQLPALLSRLLGWAADNDEVDELTMRLAHGPAALRLQVDAADAGGRWSGAGLLRWEVRDPAGRWRRGLSPPKAPGRFELRVQAPVAGRYDLELMLDGQYWRGSIHHSPRVELLLSRQQTEARARFATLSRWEPADGVAAIAGPAASARVALIVSAALLFLALLVRERFGPHDLR